MEATTAPQGILDSDSVVEPASVVNGGLASEQYRELAGYTNRQLEEVWAAGEQPTLDGMLDWEYIGWNTSPPGIKLAKLQKFSKGLFTANDGEAYGYNTPLVQNGLTEPWITKPDDDNPRRWRFYRVQFDDPLEEKAAALILNYSRGGNGFARPYNRLLNYLVRVNPGSDELVLGKAYGVLGPVHFRINFFLLERHRKVSVPAQYMDRG